MKKSTAALRKQLAEAEQEDERHLSELQSLLGSIEVLKDDAEKRRELFHAAIDEQQNAHIGELETLEQKLRGIIARQSGTPIMKVVEGERASVPVERKKGA